MVSEKWLIQCCHIPISIFFTALIAHAKLSAIAVNSNVDFIHTVKIDYSEEETYLILKVI
jgi:hypothetical protein